MSKPFTDEEQVIIDSLVKAWNAFLKLKPTANNHVEEFAQGINKCQDIIGHRVLQRDYPDHFQGSTDNDKPKSVKYILMPGYVRSLYDREHHYVTAHELARLYGVSMKECVIAPEVREGWKPNPNMILLPPRSDGMYCLPEGDSNND